MALFFFGALLGVAVLEMVLRFSGLIMIAAREYRNLNSIRQKGTYRILCVGESTTFFGGGASYPSQLEIILNQSSLGIRFSVINKGIAATWTSRIVSHLEEYLDRYSPDAVAVMMGINDTVLFFDEVTFSKPTLLFRNLSIVRLTRLVWSNFFSPSIATDMPLSKDNQLYLESDWIKLAEVNGDEQIDIINEDLLKRKIESNSKDEMDYLTMGLIYNLQDRLPEAAEMLQKAVQLNPKNSLVYAELGWVYKKLGRLKEAKEFHERAIELNPEHSIRHNYRKLKYILDKRGIQLICIQYPMKSIKPLKEIFDSNEGVIFVDNEGCFRDAVSIAGYGEYFVDAFAGEFGHCTPEGNRLLAQNIADTLIKEFFLR